MPTSKECASLRVMRKNRKTWLINPKSRVVPNKKKKMDKHKKNLYNSGDE